MSRIVFTGVRNERPVFSFPGEVAPAWLRDLGFAKVETKGGEPVLNAKGKKIRVGEELRPEDFSR